MYLFGTDIRQALILRTNKKFGKYWG